MLWKKFSFGWAFAKFIKPTTSSVCLSVRMGRLGSIWADIHEILHLILFRKKNCWKRRSFIKINNNNKYFTFGPGSSVGIATELWAGRSGIECQLGWDFPHLSIPSLGPTQPPIQWLPDLSWGVEVVGTCGWPPTPSSAEVLERVELHLYSP